MSTQNTYSTPQELYDINPDNVDKQAFEVQDYDYRIREGTKRIIQHWTSTQTDDGIRAAAQRMTDDEPTLQDFQTIVDAIKATPKTYKRHRSASNTAATLQRAHDSMLSQAAGVEAARRKEHDKKVIVGRMYRDTDSTDAATRAHKVLEQMYDEWRLDEGDAVDRYVYPSDDPAKFAGDIVQHEEKMLKHQIAAAIENAMARVNNAIERYRRTREAYMADAGKPTTSEDPDAWKGGR